MDWLCPGYNAVLAKQLTSLYGNITVENGIKFITPIVQTGSLITTYYDFTRDVIYTANARGKNETGADNAFDRSFVKLDMNELFNEKKLN